MPWLDRYLQASFRGVEFEVDAHEAQLAGRRGQTHEYPGQEEPYDEDLGRAAKEFEVDGYIVGDDYMERLDRLEEACDRSGPGLLVHPYRGRRRVRCRRLTVMERTSQGRMCTLRFDFVEAGRNRFPADRADTGAVLFGAADAAGDAMADQFDSAFAFPSSPASFVAEQLQEAVDDVVGDLPDLANGSIAERILSGYGVGGAPARVRNAIGAASRPVSIYRPRDVAWRILAAVRDEGGPRLETVARKGLEAFGVER